MDRLLTKVPHFFRYLIGQYVTVHGDVISHLNISASRVEDGGLYSCVAANRAGAAAHSSRLNVYGPYFQHSCNQNHGLPPVQLGGGIGHAHPAVPRLRVVRRGVGWEYLTHVNRHSLSDTRPE